jgi:hypothetical protein
MYIYIMYISNVLLAIMLKTLVAYLIVKNMIGGLVLLFLAMHTTAPTAMKDQ